MCNNIKGVDNIHNNEKKCNHAHKYNSNNISSHAHEHNPNHNHKHNNCHEHNHNHCHTHSHGGKFPVLNSETTRCVLTSLKLEIALLSKNSVSAFARFGNKKTRRIDKILIFLSLIIKKSF